MNGRAHILAVLAGVLCLLALAALLWEPDQDPADIDALDDARCAGKRHREQQRAALPVIKTRVVSYYRGKTTIEPLVRDAYLTERDNSGPRAW